MRIIGLLLRIFSYVFHLVLCVFAGAVGVVGYLTPHATFATPLLPWAGRELACWLLGGAAVGLFALFLAVTGRFRPLFTLWALAVAVLLFRGLFQSGYSFDGVDHFKQALWLFVGSVLAFLASLTGYRR